MNTAEDDASQSSYHGQWEAGKNGGYGFLAWTQTSDGNDGNRHSGFYIANTKSSPVMSGIARDGKAFGLYANGFGFEQAVAYRGFERPIAMGDSFSYMMENGKFEKKFDKDDPTAPSAGLSLRTSNASGAVTDYNKDSVFEFGYYDGKDNYQIVDGTGNADSGIPLSASGVIVTVTITGVGTYDLEVQTLPDKKLIKLPGRKLKTSGEIRSLALFDRNSEKADVYFNQFQVCREVK